MIQKPLLRQIWNERRGNIWILIELFVVFIVLCFLIDKINVFTKTYREPLGFDITNTYLVFIKSKTEKSPSFLPSSTKQTKPGEDLLEIASRLRRLPEVEAVSLSINSRPYAMGNSSFRYKRDTLEHAVLKREVTPDFFQVFGYENIDGTGYGPLADALRKGEIVVSENILPENPHNGSTLKGQLLMHANDTNRQSRIGAVTHKVRYGDYATQYENKYIAFLLKEKEVAEMNSVENWVEVSLRVKEGTPPGFADRVFLQSDSHLNAGNLFILGVVPIKELRRTFNIEGTNYMVTFIWMVSFLLVNIFLGIFGTFWFRTQHRRSELGLRIALGSTRIGLWKQLTLEGIFLLAIAAIPAIIICWYAGYAGLMDFNDIEWGWTRFFLCIGITFLLIAIMIVLGILYPAWQAMKLEPTEALHEE